MSIPTRRYLPQEAVRNIAGYLEDDDMDLRRCSLVCRSWVRPSQAALFRSLDICLREGRSFESVAVSTALKHLSRFSHLGDAVRSLHLTLGFQYGDEATKRGKEQQQIAVASILKLLPRLVRLTLKGSPLHETVVGPALLRALQDTLASPSLLHITFVYCDIPVLAQVFNLMGNHFEMLHSLTLEDLGCRRFCSVTSPDSDNPKPITIKKLTIRSTYLRDIMACFKSLPNAIVVKNICLFCELGEGQTTSFLELFSSSLEELTVRGEYPFEPLPESFQFRALTALRTLTINSNDLYILDQLNTIDSSSHLESLTIQMYDFSVFDNPTRPRFEELDRLLGSKPRFPSLKMVKLLVNSEGDCDTNWPFVVMRKRFHLLLLNSLLQVECDDLGPIYDSKGILEESHQMPSFYPSDFDCYFDILSGVCPDAEEDVIPRDYLSLFRVDPPMDCPAFIQFPLPSLCSSEPSTQEAVSPDRVLPTNEDNDDDDSETTAVALSPPKEPASPSPVSDEPEDKSSTEEIRPAWYEHCIDASQAGSLQPLILPPILSIPIPQLSSMPSFPELLRVLGSHQAVGHEDSSDKDTE